MRIFGYLVLILALTSCTETRRNELVGGTQVGGGGNTWEAEFVGYGYEISGMLDKKPIAGVDSKRFLETVLKAKVHSRKLKAPIDVRGRNIDFDLAHWKAFDDTQRYEKVFLAFEAFLTQMGVPKPGEVAKRLDELNFCGRQEPIRLEIERVSRRYCYQIGPPDLGALDTLNFSGKGLLEIHPEDLAHLSQTTDMDFSENRIQELNGAMFRDLHSLKTLNLSHNRISQIAPGTFSTLVELVNYNLTGNSLDILRTGALRGLGKFVSLSGHTLGGTVLMDTWDNPVTGMKVRVVHVLNDPVQRFYPLEKGPFAPPYPYLVNGDNLVFQLDVFRPPVPGNNPLTRKEYPLHSQQDVYQTGELWAIHGSLAALNNPENTRVPCHTAWGRISMWEPFFEMGNRPGVVIQGIHNQQQERVIIPRAEPFHGQLLVALSEIFNTYEHGFLPDVRNSTLPPAN